MKSKLWIIGLSILLSISCSHKKEIKSKDKLTGTWQLVSSEVYSNGNVSSENMTGKKMIKLINNSHFAFLFHDLKAGKDSTALYVSGGGTCTITDSSYSEFLEFCNYRDWEGLIVDFKINYNHDTLVLSGNERKDDIKVNQFITEKYVKIGE